MRHKLVISILIPLALVLPENFHAPSQNAALQQRIDAVFSRVTSPDAPGLAVLVRKNGFTVFARGYGVRDLRVKAKIDAQTNFRLASFTKQFTAMAIMLLTRERKLRYDESITKSFLIFSPTESP